MDSKAQKEGNADTEMAGMGTEGDERDSKAQKEGNADTEMAGMGTEGDEMDSKAQKGRAMLGFRG